MKTKTESSTRTERDKKLNIFRFSIKPTLIKSGIMLTLILLFYFIVLPRFIIPVFVVYDYQLALVHKVFVFCRILFLVLIIFTGVRCLYTSTKKVRIRKGTIMYRYGFIFQRTKVYSYTNTVIEASLKNGLVQKISNVCTVKIAGLQLGDEKKKKRKCVVFRNMKHGGEFLTTLLTAK